MSGRDRLNFRFLESVIPSEAAGEVEESLEVADEMETEMSRLRST